MNGSEILKSIEKSEIKNFRGIVLRNKFPKEVHENECGIINKSKHWVCYWKKGNTKVYFDSFGKKPPKSLFRYLGDNIYYNTKKIQKLDESNCGDLCIEFLNLLCKFFH